MCGGRSRILHYGPLIETNYLYAPTPNGQSPSASLNKSNYPQPKWPLIPCRLLCFRPRGQGVLIDGITWLIRPGVSCCPWQLWSNPLPQRLQNGTSGCRKCGKYSTHLEEVMCYFDFSPSWDGHTIFGPSSDGNNMIFCPFWGIRVIFGLLQMVIISFKWIWHESRPIIRN